MAPPVIGPADRFSSLPDEILAQILSFVPAQEAVRTCVLARTWRHVWKFTRRLLIAGGTVTEAREFVDRLLALRLNGLECASLDECEIRFWVHEHEDYDTRFTVNGWIHTSLKCQVQMLLVLNEHEEHGLNNYFLMSNRPLISQHLTRLELRGAWFFSRCLNLDGCPALEHLEIRSCFLGGQRKIMSPSLKRLVITGCKNYEDARPFKISVPHLVSLWLEVAFRAPLLESMPKLVEAHVRIDSFRAENCSCDDPKGCYHVMRPGYISDGDVDSDIDSGIDSDNEEDRRDYPEGSVLLEGLAQAKHLVLLAQHSRYIFRRDLRLCPTFSNLKALVLNGYWCEPADCCALSCILEHAPVLEKLTILFSEKVELEYDTVLEGHPATAVSTMTTQCLKTVKVKCHTVDEGVQNVLKFLSTLNICLYAGVDKEQQVEGANLMLKLAKDVLAAQHTRRGNNFMLTDGDPQDPEDDEM